MDKICTYVALSFIKSFSDPLKQGKNISKMLITGRFNKNLNVIRLKTVPCFPLFEKLCREGKEDMGTWEARRAREEGGRRTRLSPPSSLPRPNSLPFPFKHLPRLLEIIKLFYNHIHLSS